MNVYYSYMHLCLSCVYQDDIMYSYSGEQLMEELFYIMDVQQALWGFKLTISNCIRGKSRDFTGLYM